MQIKTFCNCGAYLDHRVEVDRFNDIVVKVEKCKVCAIENQSKGIKECTDILDRSYGRENDN